MLEWLELLDRALLLKINALHTPLLDTFMWYMSESWHTILLYWLLPTLFIKNSPQKSR